MVASFEKSSKDKTLTINHQMGRIVLHSVPARTSGLRVRMHNGAIEALGRGKDGAWSKDAPTVHPKFLAALQQQLVRAESQSYWYIDKDVAQQVSRRFERSR